MLIKTDYDPKPIPIRLFDWCAWDDQRGEDYECGWGETEIEAIRDFLVRIEEREDVQG